MSFLDQGSRDDEVIVMLHGNPSWSYYWRHLVSELSASNTKENYRCIVPDHIGMGLSDKPGDSTSSSPRYHYTLQSRIDDLANLLDHLGINRPVTLAVHDWGGLIGFGWALSHRSQVQRLIILNTAAFPLPASKSFPWQLSLGRRSQLGGLIIRACNLFAHGASWLGTQRQLAKEVRHAYTRPYSGWNNTIATLRFIQDIPLQHGDISWPLLMRVQKMLPEISNIPVLIGWGLRDFVFDQEFLNKFISIFKNAEVHTFADAGHYVLEDKHLVLTPVIRQFLQSNPL